MQQVIMSIHLMVVIALVALVLYQKSEGSALGLGQSGLFTGRGQANALTRATSILGFLFFLTSVLLTVLPAWERRAAGGEDWTKAFDQKIEVKEIPPPAAGAAPEAKQKKPSSDESTSIFEQLKRAQEQRRSAGPQTEAAPAAPPPAMTPEVPAAPPAAEAKPELRPSTEAAPQPAPEAPAPTPAEPKKDE
ncbi:MAG TPA: preprotein translocase subunit SecG [Methylocystis sp.]|nr:preprotein translocase subunit SecG [Methylocystis sp.]